MHLSNCDRCYRRKSRCDKLKPSCGPCSRAGVSCHYTDRSKERRFSTDHVERLERRIHQAETRNQQLTEELTRAKVAASADGRSNSTVSPGPTRAVDAVSEVSSLSINAAGERQPYLGSTSGLLFADLVRSTVNIPSSSSRQVSPPPDIHGDGSGAVTPSRSLRKYADLPTKPLAQRLYSAYFNHDAIIYPFLAPSPLLDRLEVFYADQDYYTLRASAFDVFVFHMILAISTTHCFKHDWQMLPGAEIHHARAMQELNPVMGAGGIESLQAVLLLCQYRTGSSVHDNSASMWHLVGIASRLCLELGLHRESTFTVRNPVDLPPEKLEIYSKQEIGRRCFWSVVAMDRITSNILGRPLAIREEDLDTLLPSEMHDAIIARPLSATIVGISRVAVFNYVLRYRLLCGKLLTTLHRKRSPGMSLSDAMRIRQSLAEELEQWHDDMEDLGLPVENHAGSREYSCYLSKIWYEVLYANASLMIWRPSPLLMDAAHDQQMLQKIFDSATHSVNAYSALHKSRQINYSWVTLQSIFMAGLSYIYAVSRHMRERRLPHSMESCYLDRDPSTIEVVNVTRACSNVLVAVAERWSTLRHCHEVFDRLSDAVLADAIKLQTMNNEQPSIRESAMNGEGNVIPQQMSTTQSGVFQAIRTQSWSSNNQTTVSYPAPLHPSPLAVDNEFLHCFDDLQHLYDQQQLEDPVMHLSQDWLGYLNGPADSNDFGQQFVGSLANLT